jgi:hypothetical protein
MNAFVPANSGGNNTYLYRCTVHSYIYCRRLDVFLHIRVTQTTSVNEIRIRV